MLPGIRFLLAAILLSISILVFGLGAAALLRAAHEDFASNPSWRVTPETKFAQQNDTPTLAMLRLDAPPPAPAEKPAETTVSAALETSAPAPTPAAAPVAQVAAVSPAPESENSAAPAVTPAPPADVTRTEAPPAPPAP